MAPASPLPKPESMIPAKSVAPEPAAQTGGEWWSAPQPGSMGASAASPPSPQSANSDLLSIESTHARSIDTSCGLDTGRGSIAGQLHTSEPDESVTGGTYLRRHEFFLAQLGAANGGEEQAHRRAPFFLVARSDRFAPRNGESASAATRDPELYCSEAPITLTQVDQAKIEEARSVQPRDGIPALRDLAQNGSISRTIAAASSSLRL